jgi:hypothetical protein
LADQLAQGGYGVVVVIHRQFSFRVFGFCAAAVEFGFGDEVEAAAGEVARGPCYNVAGGITMNTLRIRRKLDSETLHLPELRPLIGKTVEIVIQEEEVLGIKAGTADWQAAERAAQALREAGYDIDAWRNQRDCDRKHAGDHVP